MTQFLNTKKNYLSNLNPVTSWKGKTFTQITSFIKNNPGNTVGNPIKTALYQKGKKVGTVSFQPNLFLPNSLKIYRREIANTIDRTSCYPRTSSSINEFDQPGGSIVNTSSSSNGLVNTLDNILPNNKCEEPGSCSTFLSPSENAKRRCRSSGIISKKNNSSNNYATYYTNANQYLVSRNKTFLQNQYNHIRVGDPLLKPNAGPGAVNVYSPNGLFACPRYVLKNDLTFSYVWVDTNVFTVNVPAGLYDIGNLQNLLINAMSANYHFLIDTTTGEKVFLIQIYYDDSVEKIQFQFTQFDNVNFPSSKYTSDPRADLWTNTTAGTNILAPDRGPSTSLTPALQFANNGLLTILGFTKDANGSAITAYTSYPVYYPNVIPGYPQGYITQQVFASNIKPQITPVYKRIYYKPNNSKFAQQGAVTSSSLINRLKFDTINDAAVKTNGNVFNKEFTNVYGSNIANALAYGVSENPYTMKDKIGYPNPTYPSFLPGSNVQRKCTDTHLRSI